MANLAEMDAEFFPTPWSQENWQNLKNLSKEHLLGIFFNGTDYIIGLSLFSISTLDSSSHLLKVLVGPESCKNGIATRMLTESFQALRKASISSTLLEVEASNIFAIKLYEKLGAEIIHRKKSFYGKGRDAQVMRISGRKLSQA